MEEIQERLAAWLPEDLINNLQASDGKNIESPPWVLEMSLAAMAASGHCLLVEDILSHPRAVRAGLWKFLCSKDALTHGSRIWLRPVMPWQEPTCLLESLKLACAAPSSLRCFSGVVIAVSAVEQAMIDCTFACETCGSKERVIGDVGAPKCCGLRMELDFSTLVTVPAQTILLSSATSTGGTLGSGKFSTPLAVVLQDDLVSSCKVGDFIACTGIADCIVGPKASGNDRKVVGEFRLEAMNVNVLSEHPSHLSIANLPEDAQILASDLHEGNLDAILGAMKAWACPASNQLVQAALLLSACCAGAAIPAEHPAHLGPSLDYDCDAYMLSRSGLHTSFPRINVLLLAEEQDGGVHARMLHTLAHALSTHTTDGSLPGSTLLPKPLSLPGMPPLVAAGQLAEANSGICLLLQGLTNKQGRAVGESLRAAQAAVSLPGASISINIPVVPTVWCIAGAPPCQKSTVGSKRRCGGQLPPGPAAFAELSPQFVAPFDVILDCCSPDDSEIEAWADDFLGLVTMGPQPGAAKLALQNHITTCQQMPAPRMTTPAMQLLSGYWNALRTAVSSEGGVPPVRLDSAAMLAAASARLCHRDLILPFPDATLAIALCEEGLIAQGWTSALWGPLWEQMAAGKGLTECLEGLYEELAGVAKAGGWGPWEEGLRDEE